MDDDLAGIGQDRPVDDLMLLSHFLIDSVQCGHDGYSSQSKLYDKGAYGYSAIFPKEAKFMQPARINIPNDIKQLRGYATNILENFGLLS